MADVATQAAAMDDTLTEDETATLQIMRYRLSERARSVDLLLRRLSIATPAQEEAMTRRLRSIARELQIMLSGARLMLEHSSPEERAATAAAFESWAAIDRAGAPSHGEVSPAADDESGGEGASYSNSLWCAFHSTDLAYPTHLQQL